MRFYTKYYNQIIGYLFITPAVLLISLFGIFPVFFGFYMSFHKWKVFKGRFLGFENYNRILGDINSFWFFAVPPPEPPSVKDGLIIIGKERDF